MEPESLQQIDRTHALWRGRRLTYFAGCDYFRLSTHPKVQAAMVEGLERYGANVAASRVTTGNHELYGKVEAALRKFFKAEAALVVSNGYATNLIVAQALAGRFEEAFMDARAHVSLVDASEFLDCPVRRFGHRDAEDLKRKMKGRRGGRFIILTDGMFSHDGAVAPLGRYLEALPKEGVMLVDDAHGAGVLGKNGRGAVELEGVERERMIQTVTLSKAFGAYGGGILCSRTLREAIWARSGMFAGSTPPPLPCMNAALVALRLLEKGQFRKRLETNVTRARNRLGRMGRDLLPGPGPILALAPRGAREAGMIRRALLRREIYPSFIKYPGGPAAGYFRLVISSEHTHKQLDDLADALTECPLCPTPTHEN